MIEKLQAKTIEKDGGAFGIIIERRFATEEEMQEKINELVDAVNRLHEEAESNARIRANHEHKIEALQKDREEIKEWIGIVSDLRSRVPVVESRVSILEEHAHPTAKTPIDLYKEQRKWVGKICKFWNDDDSPDDVMYGELVNIFDVHKEDCPFQCGYGEWYEHCEPVKPDDDIIYKGGDND